ncbi:MAG: MBL fold metallo-hydrolase [bacterium]|nr:MAG: MBL fold metallo-hydrolase [bacterium]
MVFRKSSFYVLVLILLSIWIFAFSVSDNLQIVACDVGQGDAILIQHKNNQVLIDGGQDKKVLDCLGRHMPFFDRQIEMVVLTHPDLDHFGGLIDVFSNYKVLKFGTNGKDVSKEEYRVLVNWVGGMDVEQVTLTSGMVVRLGLIYLDIVHPAATLEINKEQNIEGDSNNQSIVMVLNYAQFKALFTGDVENDVSDQLSNNIKVNNLDYIKVNHHGSRNGLSENLLKAVNPRFAVISSGFKNRYGHPHAEILEILKKYDVNVLRTDEIGDIVIETDGQTFWQKNNSLF